MANERKAEKQKQQLRLTVTLAVGIRGAAAYTYRYIDVPRRVVAHSAFHTEFQCEGGEGGDWQPK